MLDSQALLADGLTFFFNRGKKKEKKKDKKKNKKNNQLLITVIKQNGCSVLIVNISMKTYNTSK